MKCPKCGSENPDGENFCGECGAKIEVIVNSMLDKGENGFKIGDKNVIAGDVNHTIDNTTNITGDVSYTTQNIQNTTIIDESRKLKVCDICGKNIAVVDGYSCLKCGRFVCVAHYNHEYKCCSLCGEATKKEEEQKQIEFKEEQSKLENSNKAVYEDAVRQKFANGVLTPSDIQELDAVRAQKSLSPEDAKTIEDRLLQLGHVVIQKNAQVFAARGEKSLVAVNNCNFQFNKSAFLINLENITNNSSWKTGNLALSIWFSPKGPFSGNLDGCFNMAVIDLCSLDPMQGINHISKQSQILSNPPSGVYTPFFAVGEQFESGMKIISSGNFGPINWNQR